MADIHEGFFGESKITPFKSSFRNSKKIEAILAEDFGDVSDIGLQRVGRVRRNDEVEVTYKVYVRENGSGYFDRDVLMRVSKKRGKITKLGLIYREGMYAERFD